MALLYPWATKEYLLWEMSISQVILYHNLGVELKFGKGDSRAAAGLVDKDEDELRAIRDEVRSWDQTKADLKAKYGEIE